MQYSFPYDSFAPIKVPDAMVDGVYELTPGAAGGDDLALIRDALARPIGCRPLRELVRPGQRIAIAVDDSSRSTRTDLMLPAVLAELAAAGVADGDITVFVALGTHRKMTDAEMADKYTPAVVARYRIVNPDWREAAAYRSVGKSKYGFDIRIHREIVEADFVIGVGQTIPHMIAGFGGGCKIINPGCSDGDTIGHMHWMCSRVPEGQLFAVRDNAVREVIDEAALKAGLKFIINEVPGAQGRLAGVFAGDPVAAHRAACDAARTSCLVKIRRRTEIVIADAYTADLDFWQALKGLNAAYGAVKPGGTVILVTPCPEGTSSQHEELTTVGYVEVETVQRLLAEGRIDQAVAANLVLGRRLLESAHAILVTHGISREQTLAMRLEWAPTPQAALDQAIARHGSVARINILHKAAKMICSC
ncbi:MAG: nickel-dependent lactate racemase [Lentisphaeria bacterium]